MNSEFGPDWDRSFRGSPRGLAFVAQIILAASLVVSGAHAAGIQRADYYTNVRYIPEAGDYLGLNLAILPGPTPLVSYELCEGWCNGASSFPAEIDGGTVRFTVREELYDPDGNPAPPRVYRVEARFVQTLLGRRLVVTSPDIRDFHEVLKPATRAR
jgi:hypothetical protein